MRAALRDAPNSDETALVTSMVKVRAILAAGTDVDSAFVPVPEREGYLKRTIHEVEVYPRAVVLSAALGLVSIAVFLILRRLSRPTS